MVDCKNDCDSPPLPESLLFSNVSLPVPPTKWWSLLLHPLNLGWPLHWLLEEAGGEATLVPFSLGLMECCFHAPSYSQGPAREQAQAARDLADGQPTLRGQGYLVTTDA